MLIKVPRGWEIPERQATPESVFLNRRQLLQAAGFLGMEGLLAQALAAQSGSGDVYAAVCTPLLNESSLRPVVSSSGYSSSITSTGASYTTAWNGARGPRTGVSHKRAWRNCSPG